MPELATAPAPETVTTETTPQTQPASVAAVVSKNFGDFREAERGRATGKPLPEVAVKPAAPAVVEGDEAPPVAAQTTEQRQTSKRQAEQNRRTQEAVDRATADLRAEITALKSAAPKPAADVQPVAKTPDYQRYMAMADAPQKADFTDPTEHAAAMSVFIADKRYEDRVQLERQEKEVASAVAEVTQTISTFQSQISDAGGNEFLDGLTDDVRSLRPAEALQANGEHAKIGPLNVLTSEIVKSKHAAKLLQHLSDHPDELATFKSLPTPAAVYLALGKLEARMDSPKTAQTPAKTVTSMSEPATTLGARSTVVADTSLAAVKTKNFRAFRGAEFAKRTA